MANIKRFMIGLAVVASALLVMGGVALAQVANDSLVTVPVGNWVETSADFIATVAVPTIMAGLLWVARLIGPTAVQVLRTFQIEQLLKRAVDYGLNSAVGATKGMKLDINVGNVVLANALDYAVAQVPKHLLAWVGGPDGLKRMIFARLELDKAVSAQALGVYTPQTNL